MPPLIANPRLVIVAIGVLFLITHVLQRIAERCARLQRVVRLGETARAGGVRMAQLAGRALLAIYVVGLGLILGGLWFRFFAGGYLVTLLVSVVQNVDVIIRQRLLATPGCSDGTISFSEEYSYKSLANQLNADGLLMLGLYAFFGSPEFPGAALILLSTALGYWRRANQARQRGRPQGPGPTEE